MTRTRWKLMIGALGISLGGLAAVAGVPAANGCAAPQTHTAQRVGDPGPAPSPKAADLPPAPAPAPAPVLPAIPAPIPVTLPDMPFPVIPVSAAPVMPLTPPMVPQIPSPTPAPVALPRMELAAPVPVPAPALKPPEPAAPRLPEPSAPPPAFAPTEATRFDPLPTPTFPEAKMAPPARVEAKPAARTPAPVEAKPEPAPSLFAEPPVAATDAPKGTERKLKVILSMGDERPRFEVRDGDEIYLKVVCDKVEVKSPGESGVSVSTMRAAGKVTFVTPGGEGTCDELAVLPGTGQVVVTGKVTFTYNWGKVETTVTGEKMNFRLGSNTVQPAPAAVPASFTRTR